MALFWSVGADNSVRVWDVKRIQLMLDPNLKRSIIMSMATKPTLMGTVNATTATATTTAAKQKESIATSDHMNAFFTKRLLYTKFILLEEIYVLQLVPSKDDII